MTQTTGGRRRRLGEDASREIKAIARRQMATEGDGAISLRGIAREMGMAQPSLYHYYPRLDDLITALIVDAYEALAGAIDLAQAPPPGGAFVGPVDDHAGRLVAATEGYRAWALANPADFTLIFGNPIPGYHAPADVTRPAFRRMLAPFLALPEAAWAADGLIPPPDDGTASPALLAGVEAWGRERGVGLPPRVVAKLMAGFFEMQGLVTAELFGHLQPLGVPPSELYRAAMRDLVRRVGMAADGGR